MQRESFGISENLKKIIAAENHLSALKVISGFCTVSIEAAGVISGTFKTEILANEMQSIYKHMHGHLLTLTQFREVR